MVDVYQTEEEQVEAIKKWWKENGKSVIAGVVIGVGGVLGWNYWQDYRAGYAARASLGFERMVKAVDEQRAEAALHQADALKSDYGSTPYATLAALAKARVHVEAGDLEAAKTELGWAIQNAPSSDFADVAKIRLARVWLAESAPDQALALLDSTQPGAFTAAVEEARGDALRVRGDSTAAKTAYQRALDAGTDNMRVVEMKLADLGLPDDAEDGP